MLQLNANGFRPKLDKIVYFMDQWQPFSTNIFQPFKKPTWAALQSVMLPQVSP